MYLSYLCLSSWNIMLKFAKTLVSEPISVQSKISCLGISMICVEFFLQTCYQQSHDKVTHIYLCCLPDSL